MEGTLVDTANLLAAQAKDDLLAGHINGGRFAASVRALTDRDLGAEIWGFTKRRIGTRIYVTDARGIVVHKQVDVSPGERVSWERLEPGNHSLRLIEDANSNGRWDAGHWQEQRQPERVRLHGEAIQVRAGWDLGIDWRLKGD